MKLISPAAGVRAPGTPPRPFGTPPQPGSDCSPPAGKVIPDESGGRMPCHAKAMSVGIAGDAKEAAKALQYRLANRKLESAENAEARRKKIKAEKDAWEAELETWMQEKDTWSIKVAENSSYMHPRQMLRELEKALPK